MPDEDKFDQETIPEKEKSIDGSQIEQIIKEKLSEQRSLETLLRTEYNSLSSSLSNSLNRRVAYYSVAISLIFLTLGLIGYDRIIDGLEKFVKTQVEDQLIDKLATPEIEKNVKTVLEQRTVGFVNDKIEPLNVRMNEVGDHLADLETLAKTIVPLEKRVTELTENLNLVTAKSKELSNDVNNAKVDSVKLSEQLKDARKQSEALSEETAALRLFFDARQGDSKAYYQIAEFAKDEQTAKGNLCKALLDDLILYYEEFKYKLVPRQSLINIKTKKRMNLTAELLHERLFTVEKTAYYRRAIINHIKDKGYKYFVEDLVYLIQDENLNLKIATRAVRTLEHLTNQKFTDYPPFSDVQIWWDNEGKLNEDYLIPFDRRAEALKLKEQGKLVEALTILDEITSKYSGLCDSHFHLGLIYISQENMIKAKEHIEIALNECDGLHLAYYAYASILFKEGKKEEFIKATKRIIPYFDDHSEVKKILIKLYGSLISEEEIDDIFEK